MTRTPATPDLLSALTEINAQVGIPLDELLRTVEEALAVAYKRVYSPAGDIRVRVDPATAEIEVESRHVAEDGTEVVDRLPADDFRQQAAQTAKQVVMRQIRDLERARAVREATEQKGELTTGIVDRLERGTVFLDMGGRAEGVMAPEDQIPGEELRPGRPVTVVVLDARPQGMGAQVRVSRAARLFVQKLLEAEVPEIARGGVQVRAVAREPGLRTKIAVASTEPGIDPVGACVGPKGVRHRSILAELGSEHVDIVPWDADPSRFVAAALGPAAVTSVEVDPDNRTAHVLV